MLPQNLDAAGNTFVTIVPADDSGRHASVPLLGDDSGRHASVPLLGDDSYEIECRDPGRRQHELTTKTDIAAIAKDLTIWLAAREYPGPPGRS